MGMSDLDLEPVPVSRSERWLLMVAAIVPIGALGWYWVVRPDGWELGAMFMVWLMLVSASLAIVRVAAYRRRARARRRIAEEVAAALADGDGAGKRGRIPR